MNTLQILLAFLAVMCLFCCTVADNTVNKCIDGPFHKKTPSAGTGFKECFPWQENACCKTSFTVELAKHRVENLYNFTWNHCGNLSAKCEAFIKHEECFWQCEPSLIRWHKSKGYVVDVPICADYCNEWYEACKDDKTCVQDWLNGFNITSSTYTCPLGSKCQTFAAIFKNGEGLCNTMWGNSFKYEASNKNCMLMNFNGSNPNTAVKPPVEGHSATLTAALASTIILVIGLFILI